MGTRSLKGNAQAEAHGPAGAAIPVRRQGPRQLRRVVPSQVSKVPSTTARRPIAGNRICAHVFFACEAHAHAHTHTHTTRHNTRPTTQLRFTPNAPSRPSPLTVPEPKPAAAPNCAPCPSPVVPAPACASYTSPPAILAIA